MNEIIVAFIIADLLIAYLLFKLHKATMYLRKNVKKGDKIRFIQNKKTRTGTVEKVYYNNHQKMVKVRWYNPETHQLMPTSINAKNIYLAR